MNNKKNKLFKVYYIDENIKEQDVLIYLDSEEIKDIKTNKEKLKEKVKEKVKAEIKDIVKFSVIPEKNEFNDR